ncbi:MAG: TonB-dependent receptor [Sphingomonadaceae bacterium]|nr:TonB-dependent receptor [Sphingomonadaceae bacterium]
MLVTSSLLALIAQAAAAQTAPPAGPPAEGASLTTAVEQAGQPPADDIVVTGSRLRQTADTTPAPVLSLGTVQLERDGTDNLATTLRELGPIGVGFSDRNSQNLYAGAGLNLIDLRRLGYERTLVLVNGRRQVPGDLGSNAVDLNTIPAPLVERVEIVTGGTSAVYGADAVSGVVNVILKKDFEGLEVRGRGGVTSRGDGQSYGVTVTGGTHFADNRGSIEVNGFYDYVDGVRASQRSYASNLLGTINNPAIAAGATPSATVPYVITSKPIGYTGPNQAGVIDFRPFGINQVYVVTPGGTSIRPYNFGAAGDLGGIVIGGDGATFQQYDNLSLPIERFGGSLNLGYKLSDAVQFFAEARITDTRVKTRWQPAADFEYGTVAISVANPYVPPLLAGAVAPFSPIFPFQRIYEDFGRRGSNSDRLSQQYTAGFDGSLGRFKWEVFGGYGQTDLNTHLIGGRNQDRFLDSINVILLNGQPACASATARANGCQPLNVFNPAATPAGIAYSSVQDDYHARQQLAMGGADITGDLFTLPAGPVGGVLGIEARRNTTGSFPSTATQGCREQLLCEQPSRGSVGVKEAYTEIRVPLLKDVPFAKELSIQGAARVSDYTIGGTNWTWNAGGTYAPTSWLRIRGERSRAVRAPNASELFSPASQTFTNLTDPCSADQLALGSATRTTNCRALGAPNGFVASTGSKAVYNSGNRNLVPEKADTWTIGLTLTPAFAKGLRITADYYDINLKQAIQPTDPSTVLLECTDTAVTPATNPYCQAITRGADFNIASVATGYLNVGRLETRGIDLALDYTFPLHLFGTPAHVNLNGQATYLDRLRVFTDANNAATEFKEEGYLPNPRWQGIATMTYATSRLEVTLRTRFLDDTKILTGELVQSPQPSNLFDLPTTGAKIYEDISVAYDLTRHANLRVNVSNIFDNAPPQRGSSGFAIFQGRDRGDIYPNLGTTFSAVLTYKL